MKRCITLALLLCLLASCGAEVAPTPDLVAFGEQIKREVFAELTASAPTATDTQAPTAPPTVPPTATQPAPPTTTATATSTPTPQPPTATASETPTATAARPTEPPPTRAATRTPRATPTPRPAQTPAPPAAAALSGTIAFAAYEPAIGGYTLFTLTSDGALHAVAHHVHQPDISPDGQLLAVKGAGAGREDLWALGIQGGNWQQLTHHLDDHYPNWSTEWMKLGFSSARQGDGVYRLYYGEDLVTTPRTAFVVGEYPILLWTGEMVFGGCDYGWGTGSNCGICRVSDGQIPTLLTSNPLDVPTDANTAHVLFLRPDGNDWDIYRVGHAGGAPVPVSPSPAHDGPAALSPDGKAIAFLSDRSGTWALYTANLQGGQLRKVLDLPAGLDFDHAPYPWWSERISWGVSPITATATPTPPGGPLLPAPQLIFPIPDDVVSSTGPTDVRWSWSEALGPNQGFEVRFWHTSQKVPSGIAAPTTEMQLLVHFGSTEAYRLFGAGFYYLDVVVVQLDPYRVQSESAPIRVKADPDK
jgi:hypothetical protein